MRKELLFLLTTSSLFASQINFEDALFKTLTNNKELKAKKLDIETSKVNLRNAKGYELGNLTFNENIARTNNALNAFGMKLMGREATFGDFGFAQFDMSGATNPLPVAPDALNHPEARTNFETKLTYELPIFTGFKLEHAKEMSALQVKANEAKYNFDEKQLQLEVLKAYNGAVVAKHFIDATNKIKETSSSFVYLATEMFKEGYTTNIDILQAEVFDMKINTMILDSKNQYELALAYLKFLTNDNQIDSVNEFKTFNSNKTDLKTLQESAIENRDDLKWMEQNTKTMASKVEFEKSGNYPMIGSHFEYGFNDNQINNIKGTKDYYTLAIGLEYKIFDGFTTSSNIEKAKIEYAKTKHYLEYMKDGLKLGVEKAYLTCKTKASVLEEKLKAQKLADDILEKSKEMYKNQLMSMNDLLLQSANQQKAITDVIMAKYELTISLAELQLSIGNDLK
ncbi:MAG: TolC family protein [Epsilonproteobacteria bacterium]|nr:TolC family protein [Campylobacterota bacterium]